VLLGAHRSGPVYRRSVPTVQLFVTCLVDGFFPEVGKATVRLLENHGCTVEFPFDQTCCGQPALNAGYRDQATSMARVTVDVLDATTGPIVVPSGSCADMITHHLPDLLDGDPAAIRVAGRTRELTAFLVDELGLESIERSGSELSVALHHSCHGLRNLGLGSQAEQLLDRAPGVERRRLEGADECCGFGGLFALELPEVSVAIMERKLQNLEASGATTLVGGDVSCLMHLAGGLHRRGSPISVRHIAEVLAGEDT
jgi:L-lactate dehydrogenase complex protein LldE